jgi:hypothetical protein
MSRRSFSVSAHECGDHVRVDGAGEFNDLAERSLHDMAGWSFPPQPLSVHRADVDEVRQE